MCDLHSRINISLPNYLSPAFYCICISEITQAETYCKELPKYPLSKSRSFPKQFQLKHNALFDWLCINVPGMSCFLIEVSAKFNNFTLFSGLNETYVSILIVCVHLFAVLYNTNFTWWNMRLPISVYCTYRCGLYSVR